MKGLITIAVLTFSLNVSAQAITDSSEVKYFVYPIFLSAADIKIGESKIVMYNFNEKENDFSIEIFDLLKDNFTKHTFYIKKTVKSETLDLSGSWEYFRIKDEQWKEVATNVTGISLKDIIVTKEIEKRDTILLFSPETYEDYWHLIDYQKVKELRKTSASSKQGH